MSWRHRILVGCSVAVVVTAAIIAPVIRLVWDLLYQGGEEECHARDNAGAVCGVIALSIRSGKWVDDEDIPQLVYLDMMRPGIHTLEVDSSGWPIDPWDGRYRIIVRHHETALAFIEVVSSGEDRVFETKDDIRVEVIVEE